MQLFAPSKSPFPFDFVYLASQSPRRRDLLEQVGAPYQLLLPKEGEETEKLEEVLEQEHPQDYVQRVTLAKLHSAFARLHKKRLPQAPVLCSDTTVALDNQIFGKPENEAHAFEMLQALQGRVHQVYSAVIVALPTTRDPMLNMRLSVSDVAMLEMSADEIRQYVASGESMGKAGAYAIQGRMAAYIQHISGSYSGIMGLPLCETAQLLKEYQIL